MSTGFCKDIHCIQCTSFQRYAYSVHLFKGLICIHIYILVALAYCSTLQVVYTPDGGSIGDIIVPVSGNNALSTDYTLGGLEPGTRYTIQVRATNGADTGPLSNTTVDVTDLGGEHLIN